MSRVRSNGGVKASEWVSAGVGVGVGERGSSRVGVGVGDRVGARVGEKVGLNVHANLLHHHSIELALKASVRISVVS